MSFLFCSCICVSMSYSETWSRHNDLMPDNMFIGLEENSSGDLHFRGTATEQSFSNLKRYGDYNKAKEVAKSAFFAVANGDVATLKRSFTVDAYNAYFPYNDSYIRESLLSVPIERRRRLIEHAKKSEVTTIPNNAGDVVTLIFTNTTTGKIFTMQLIDLQMNNDWKINEVW